MHCLRRSICRLASSFDNYYNALTGTSGRYNAGRQYDAWTDNATCDYDRTANTPAAGSGNVTLLGEHQLYLSANLPVGAIVRSDHVVVGAYLRIHRQLAQVEDVT